MVVGKVAAARSCARVVRCVCAGSAAVGGGANMREAAAAVAVLVAAVADAVKTPTLVIDGEPKVPGNTPYKTGVLTVESIYCKFCPGWATRLFVAPPVESYPMSNCHKLFALDVKLLKEYAVGPKPLPSSLSVCHCSKPAE